jgi:hypothetical protein
MLSVYGKRVPRREIASVRVFKRRRVHMFAYGLLYDSEGVDTDIAVLD